MKHENFELEHLDWSTIQARMTSLGIPNIVALASEVDVSRSSLYKAKRSGQCSKKIFDAILQGLGFYEEKLRRMPMRQELPETRNDRIPPNGWTVESIESPILVAANEVSYQVVKLKSTLISHPPRYARAKFYDALYAPPVSQREYQERLTRHAAVCSRLPRRTLVPHHIDVRVLGEGSAYWVLDEWIPSQTLSKLIDEGIRFSESRIKAIGMQILETLAVLHANQIIVRELSPERLLLDENSGDCYVTDFEMAKILDTDISVSGKWKLPPPYRAPEVSDNDCHWQSDLYSWAIILVELLSGVPDRDERLVQANSPTATIGKLLAHCLDVRFHYRPKSIDDVIQVLEKWRPNS